MEVYTIGFTQKNAERFFGLLRSNGIKRLIDVRLNNTSQLAGFTKQDDLRFFLREICSSEYIHMPSFAPTEGMLKAYKNMSMDWAAYEDEYKRVIGMRSPAKKMDREYFTTPTVLLCSEHTSERCHRRLAAEYLAGCFDLSVVHI